MTAHRRLGTHALSPAAARALTAHLRIYGLDRTARILGTTPSTINAVADGGKLRSATISRLESRLCPR